ncbi:MAG: hypothetical protein ABI295_02395 [Xanthomarina sp.]
MPKYYNANVLTDYNTTINYNNISRSKLNSFIAYLDKNVSYKKIFFYEKTRWDAKGKYVANYNPKYGWSVPKNH